MTILMTRTPFGRYVFAIGGNPEAAALSGINTRAMTVKIFALMGGLAGLAGVIASARLNSATNALGDLDELYVIAAAVVGGTSLAGGVGTIYGAIIGALVLVSLQTGMVLIGFGDGLVPQDRHRRGAGRRRVARHRLSQAHQVTGGPTMTKHRTGTPLVEMRDISISFGGIKAVDHVTVDLYPGEVVGCWATTGRASRHSSNVCRGPTRPIRARSAST